jgi:hypothetical protein
MTIPSDGGLPLGGAAPVLIQWPPGVHPARSLAGSGCSLAALEVFHPEPSRVSSVLHCIGLESPPRVLRAEGANPYLVAHIQTPNGLRRLPAA